MIGASKILTVSYGTFSCTLEGFDDPFNTMRAIAEYFRDLAAEDRYFGAEPPTPDAAMLHRIAEREVQRRVDAKVQDNGIHLRASDTAASAAPPPVASAPIPVAPAPEVAAAPAAPTPALAPAPAPATLADPTLPAESIAERLLRLRSEVAAQQQSAPVPVPQPISAGTVSLAQISLDQQDYAEDITDEPDLSAAAMLADFLPEDVAPVEAPAPLSAVDPLPEDTTPEPLPVEPLSVEPLSVEPLPALTETAPMPQIAEPVAEPVAETPAEPVGTLPTEPSDIDLPESLLAALAGPHEDLPDTSALSADEAMQTAAAAPDDQALSPAATVQDDAVLAASLSSILTLTRADAAQPADIEPQPEPASALTAADDILPAENPDDLSADLASDLYDDADTEPEDEPAGLDSIFGEVVDLPPALPLPELRPGAAEKLQRARARVYKIRRVDALPTDSAPDTAPGSASESAVPSEADTALSAEAELDLERELAALRDDAPAAPRASAHPFGDPSAEDAVSRLMAQADTEMEGEETKRRQSAIAHLKAAVAQTVADRRAGEVKADPEPSRIARYRNDLAMVVRSALPGSMQPKPPGERPAPLVLVSEQRIDRPPRPIGGPIPANPAITPVTGQPSQIRPRRVTGSGNGAAMQAQAFAEAETEYDDLDLHLEEALAESDDEAAAEADAALAPAGAEASFRDYAERLGAASLREMIEAAAAFLICDQKRPHFTRPQLMRHVSMLIPQTDSLREDSLRVFGTLLRDGHIAKVRRGQFSLTEASPYHMSNKRNPG